MKAVRFVSPIREGEIAMIASLGLRGKLWLTMGILLASLLAVSAGTVIAVRQIIGNVDRIKSSSAPMAISSSNLLLWNERAMGRIDAAGQAARKDLLDGLKEVEGHAEKYLAEMESLTAGNQEDQERVKKIRPL